MIESIEIELTDEQLESVIGGAERHFQHRQDDWDEHRRRDEDERRRHHHGHWGWWNHHRRWDWDD